MPADRNEPGKIRGIAFVTYKELDIAKECIQQMHGRNYHGREITVNCAKPRGPDPKKDGTFHTDDRYRGKYDAGGRLRAEFRDGAPGNINDGFSSAYAGPAADPRRDRDDTRTDSERERDYLQEFHTSGNSYDGSGRYGDRDPRPAQAYYD